MQGPAPPSHEEKAPGGAADDSSCPASLVPQTDLLRSTFRARSTAEVFAFGYPAGGLGVFVGHQTYVHPRTLEQVSARVALQLCSFRLVPKSFLGLPTLRRYGLESSLGNSASNTLGNTPVALRSAVASDTNSKTASRSEPSERRSVSKESTKASVAVAPRNTARA